MSKKRRRFTDATKFKIVIEAIKGQKQIREIASEYEVHPNQIGSWKKQFMDRGASVSSNKNDSKLTEKESQEEDIYEKISKQLREFYFSRGVCSTVTIILTY